MKKSLSSGRYSDRLYFLSFKYRDNYCLAKQQYRYRLILYADLFDYFRLNAKVGCRHIAETTYGNIHLGTNFNCHNH